MTSEFQQRLEARWAAGKLICIGLDPDPNKIPACVRKGDNVPASIVEFNEKIIDATADIAAVYKPNRAFYARFGPDGIQAFNRTVDYIHKKAPGVLVVDDSKYGDIGNTNEGYAEASFADSEADAVTVNPYPGGVDLGPFLKQERKGIIILCRMSTPGAAEFQDALVMFDDKVPRAAFEDRIGEQVYLPGVPLYQYVAYRVTRHWNERGNCGLVVGATCPEQMAAVRKIDRDILVLMPGFGKQGGQIPAAIAAGKGCHGFMLMPSNSSAITHASTGDDFMEAARREAVAFHANIQACLSTEAR